MTIELALTPDTRRADPAADLIAAASGAGFAALGLAEHDADASCAAVLAEASAGRAGVLIDSWHFFRGDSTWEQLACIPLERIAYIQFDDAPAPAGGSAIRHCRRHARGSHDEMRQPADWLAAPVSGTFLHLIDRVRHQAVGLTVDLDGGLGIGCLDQAEDLPLALVHPVAQVTDVIFALSGQVGLVCLGDIVHRHAGAEVVDIHEQWHSENSSLRAPDEAPG